MLDEALKVTQICFYFGTMFLGIRTYIYAKKNIINTVHLEYQKKVINRLDEIATTLFCEFDDSSELYWDKTHRFEKQLEPYDNYYEENKFAIMQEGIFWVGITEHPLISGYLDSFYMKVKSDPFIPDAIRTILVEFLQIRIVVFRSAYCKNLVRYQEELARGELGKYSVATRHSVFRNWMMDSLREKNCSMGETEIKISSIRSEIREYFERYNPLK